MRIYSLGTQYEQPGMPQGAYGHLRHVPRLVTIGQKAVKRSQNLSCEEIHLKMLQKSKSAQSELIWRLEYIYRALSRSMSSLESCKQYNR
jgi:hypothetical protein